LFDAQSERGAALGVLPVRQFMRPELCGAGSVGRAIASATPDKFTIFSRSHALKKRA